MKSLFFRTHTPRPTLTSAGSDTKPDHSPATPAPATPAKSGGIASHFGLYGSKKRLPTPPAISHKNHRHIEDTARAEIRAIDQEIQAAFNQPDKAGSVAAALTKLLDKPFFQPPEITKKEIAQLLAGLDDCPIAPTEDEAKKSAEKFIQDYTALQERYIPEAKGISDKEKLKELEVMAEHYLKSNRSNKADLETKLTLEIKPRLNMLDSSKRGSAQKMALETFAKAFPLTISNDKNHLTLLKKLIDTLPNLEHHDVIERNPQRRGLRVLEKALDNLQSNDAANVLAHLMDGISDLSQKLSRRKANFMKLKPGISPILSEPIMRAVLGVGTTGQLGISMISTGLSVGAPFAAIPAAAAALLGVSLWGGTKYMTLHKQPQGTALFLLKDQLAKLRKDWDHVAPANQQQLTDAFKNLQSSYDALAGTKKSTLKRFFNDDFIDPSKFDAKPNSTAELGKRLRHNFLAPITSRSKPVTNLSGLSGVRGYATATAEQKKLTDLLMAYHKEAKTAGVPGAKFSAGFLENFIEKTKAPEFENAAEIVGKSFARVKEMAEYNSEIGKARLLSQIVEMTNRLAVGDETFIRDFAARCVAADANCQNNARQIFKEMTRSVIIDKALKGEDGLNDTRNLLALGRGFFHQDELKAATREAIPLPDSQADTIETEVGIAVEIALGKRFGIPDHIQGMGYSHLITTLVTPEKLKSIQGNIEKRISNKEAWIDYLMKSWEPLTRKITENPAFKKIVEERISKAYEAFERAEEVYFAIEGKATDEQKITFEAAGIEYQNAERGTATKLLRETIEKLVDNPSQTIDAILAPAIVRPRTLAEAFKEDE